MHIHQSTIASCVMSQCDRLYANDHYCRRARSNFRQRALVHIVYECFIDSFANEIERERERVGKQVITVTKAHAV